MNLNDLVSQATAARLRGVDRAAIADLIKRGRLKSVVIDGVPLVMSAGRLFGRWLFQSPWVEFQGAADERRRITASHFCGGLAKLVGDRLARVSTGCAPSLQSGFEFEQIGRDSRIHERTSENEITISEVSIETASSCRHAGSPKEVHFLVCCFLSADTG